jgi:phage terminase large subunit
MTTASLDLKYPVKFEPFLHPKRYKVAYGGRGSAKSWTIATFLVVLAYQKKLRILCCREIQKSIDDSVLQLLADTIQRLGLSQFFDVQRTQILGNNGSRFLFEGLRTNTNKIKSMEGINIVWIEEAETVSNRSWNILIPTIRTRGSEIWVSFNPLDELDPAYQRFVIDPPEQCFSIKVNYNDNPWFTEELEYERLELKGKNPDLYDHVWEGNCFANKDGAYYVKYLSRKQITRVPVEPDLRVHTSWDLGIADATAIWFWQCHGKEVRFVNYYENSGEGLPHYIRVVDDFMREHGVLPGQHVAPHDIKNREWGSGQSRIDTARNLGIVFKQAPRLSIMDGIEATRSLLPNAWFDQERCAPGLRAVRNYRKLWDDKRQAYQDQPLHDWTSHGADGLRMCAVSKKIWQPKRSTITDAMRNSVWQPGMSDVGY